MDSDEFHFYLPSGGQVVFFGTIRSETIDNSSQPQDFTGSSESLWTIGGAGIPRSRSGTRLLKRPPELIPAAFELWLPTVDDPRNFF
jgi:hypothetical protein